jgi:hypothetical protein
VIVEATVYVAVIIRPEPPAPPPGVFPPPAPTIVKIYFPGERVSVPGLPVYEITVGPVVKKLIFCPEPLDENTMLDDPKVLKKFILKNAKTKT